MTSGSSVDVDDMRRRCRAHGRWMQEHDEAVVFGERWADRNLDELKKLLGPALS
jgi:hypothetical protein